MTAAAVTSMVVLAFSIPLGVLVRWVAESRATDAARLESRSLAAALANTADPTSLRVLVDQANAGNPRPVTVYLADGGVIGVPQPVDPAVELARQGRSFTAAARGGGRDVLVGVVRADGTPLVVRVQVPSAELRRGVDRSWLVIGILGTTLTVVAVAVADRLGRSIVRPIAELEAVARRLQAGDLAARSLAGGPPEVAEVGAAINELAERIDGFLVAEREAAADTSHRLRTPLTALRLHAERLADPAERALLAADVEAIQRSVDEVIVASRLPRASGSYGVSGSAITGARRTSDLSAVVRTRAVFWSVLADHQSRSLSVEADGAVLAAASAGDVGDALDALVANVFAHTPEGTAFRIGVSAEPDASVLEVEDDGPGFGLGGLPERGRSGGIGSTGLGLDIVRQCAEASGGTMRMEAGARGGAKVVVRFGPGHLEHPPSN